MELKDVSTSSTQALVFMQNLFIQFFELKKFNEAFTEKIQGAKTTEELLEIWEQMNERSFLN